MESPLIEPGITVWRKEMADRFALLIDADEVFTAMSEAFAEARRSILMVGWDFHSGTPMRKGKRPSEDLLLRDLISDLLTSNSELEVRILCWEPVAIYLPDRELFPALGLPLAFGKRLRFEFDGRHPSWSSHHQKMVVVDDDLAFVGGLDLGCGRWDTPFHLPNDPRRCLPNGKSHGPVHDVACLVDGAAARAVADLAKERWLLATGENVPNVEPERGHWPASITPLTTRAATGLARTVPPFPGVTAVREIEALYLRAISMARKFMYIENQYFSSPRLASALARRLQELHGPEILLVLPWEHTSFVEHYAVEPWRCELLRSLVACDRYRRLRIMSPVRCEAGGRVPVYVHSKVLVVDDEHLIVGSANLSPRSMGMDTEANIVFSAEGDPEKKKAVVAARQRLLADHAELVLTPIDVPQGSNFSRWTVRVFDSDRIFPHEELQFQLFPQEKAMRWIGASLNAFRTASAVTAALWALSVVSPRSVALLKVFLGAGRVARSGALLPLAFAPMSTRVVFSSLLLPFPRALTTNFLLTGLGCVGGYALGALLPRHWVLWLAKARSREGEARSLFSRMTYLSFAGLWLTTQSPMTRVNVLAGNFHASPSKYLAGSLAALVPHHLLLGACAASLRFVLASPRRRWLALAEAAGLGLVAVALWIRGRKKAPWHLVRELCEKELPIDLTKMGRAPGHDDYIALRRDKSLPGERLRDAREVSDGSQERRVQSGIGLS